ncbi:MAG: hypothetical protein R3202_04870 [Candidatus Competibacterales bacterium]|nr:hypothetical protein [Candidatus Competibacterales bacterium]
MVLRGFKFLLPTLWALLLGIFGVVQAQPVDGLQNRVQAFWEARVAGDPITAFQYEEVSVNDTVTLQQYARSKGNIRYRTAEVLDIHLLTPDEARAEVAIEGVIPGLPDLYKGIVKDRWVKIDGTWYHAPKPSRLGNR